jgi:16S rRNA (adenine1518-N6/adenine1519-N6)-dimethyltransferase
LFEFEALFLAYIVPPNPQYVVYVNFAHQKYIVLVVKDIFIYMKIFEILKKYKIEPRRSAGQNFLIDENILRKIVGAAELKNTDNVLEIGPGVGILTEQLVKSAKQVTAVELDKSLHFVLKKEFKGVKNLELINADILELKEADLKKIFNNEPYKIVANIPYNITSFVFRKFLEQFEYKPTEIVLLVQKEVAKRLVAKPGDLSLLAVSVQYFSEPKIVDYVSKNCFYPAPEVDSAIILLKVKNEKFDADENKNFFRVVKIGFSAKRKQLLNNLINGLKIDREVLKEIFNKIGIKDTARAQELSVENWKLIVKLI